jgi:hypothetical protein
VQSPIEFGHKVFLAESARGLITQYDVLDGNPVDEQHVVISLVRHRQTFGDVPKLYGSDRGFFSEKNVTSCKQQGVKVVCIPQRGRHRQAALGRLRQPAERRRAPPYDPKAPVSQQFANPVHCVKIANDGLVYVCDRINNRRQVFKKDGSFVKEWFFEKNTLGNGALWDVAIWPDPKQSYLSSADGENNEIRVLKRGDGSVVGTAMAAMPDSFTGFTRWPSTTRATCIPPRSTPESASRNSG